MSKIKININAVRRNNEELRQSSKKISSVSQSIRSVTSNLDSRILSRRNIGQRLKNAYYKSTEIENQLNQLISFIDTSMEQYEKAEKKVQKQAEELKKLWDLRLRTAESMRTWGGLGKSYAGVLTTGIVFSDREKFGGEEETTEEFEKEEKRHLGLVEEMVLREEAMLLIMVNLMKIWQIR